MCEIRFGELTQYDVTPEEFGLGRYPLAELIGGTPAENAVLTRDILAGKITGAKRDIVVLNAALALYLGTDDCTVAQCIDKAKALIDSGAALKKLEEFAAATREETA